MSEPVDDGDPRIGTRDLRVRECVHCVRLQFKQWIAAQKGDVFWYLFVHLRRMGQEVLSVKGRHCIWCGQPKLKISTDRATRAKSLTHQEVPASVIGETSEEQL